MIPITILCILRNRKLEYGRKCNAYHKQVWMPNVIIWLPNSDLLCHKYDCQMQAHHINVIFCCGFSSDQGVRTEKNHRPPTKENPPDQADTSPGTKEIPEPPLPRPRRTPPGPGRHPLPKLGLMRTPQPPWDQGEPPPPPRKKTDHSDKSTDDPKCSMITVIRAISPFFSTYARGAKNGFEMRNCGECSTELSANYLEIYPSYHGNHDNAILMLN